MLNLTNMPNSNDPYWKAWFDSRPSTKLINDNAKARLFRTFDHSIQKEACKRAPIEHDQTILFFKKNMGGNQLNVLHHLKKIGGNGYDSEEQFGAIQGVGEDTSCVITPDVIAISEMPMEQGYFVPSKSNICGAKTESDVNKIL